MESDLVFVPARLSPQFLAGEGFEDLPEHHSIARQCCDVHPQQCTGESRVSEVHLRGLHQAAEAIRMPGRQLLEQEDALEQRHVLADRGAAHLKRRG